jgi:hypothetical protein
MENGHQMKIESKKSGVIRGRTDEQGDEVAGDQLRRGLAQILHSTTRSNKSSCIVVPPKLLLASS